MDDIKVQQKLINREAPVMYRLVGEKLITKFSYRRITRKELKMTLGYSFKIDKQHQGRVINELEAYGMVIMINKFDYFVNWVSLE